MVLDLMFWGVLILFAAALVYASYREEKKMLAAIPEEFQYVFVCGSSDCLAIDLRNKKIFLSLKRFLSWKKKMYDFADIQRYERDSRTIQSYSKGNISRTTYYYLTIYVNDSEKAMWKFITTNSEESFDCMELLISRALDGTLPDTDERRILKIGNSKEIKSFLTSGTGAQGDSSGTGEQTESSRRAAEQGDADAMYELGESYNYGLGVEENEEQAVEWYRKAAELGHAGAMYGLGGCYYFGKGVEVNEEQAVEWYRKAAELGHADAMYELGECYYYGTGVTKNMEQAVKWYRKAAELGHADAMYELGECYYYGHGVEVNEEQAVEWYHKAAELRQTDAMHMLAECYSSGTGVRQDAREAAQWVRRAKEQDDTGIE